MAEIKENDYFKLGISCLGGKKLPNKKKDLEIIKTMFELAMKNVPTKEVRDIAFKYDCSKSYARRVIKDQFDRKIWEIEQKLKELKRKGKIAAKERKGKEKL